MKRTLSLKRETLVALTPAELTGVAGGAEDTRPQPTPPQYVVTHTCVESLVNCTTWCPYLTQGSSCDYC